MLLKGFFLIMRELLLIIAIIIAEFLLISTSELCYFIIMLFCLLRIHVKYLSFFYLLLKNLSVCCHY